MYKKIVNSYIKLFWRMTGFRHTPLNVIRVHYFFELLDGRLPFYRGSEIGRLLGEVVMVKAGETAPDAVGLLSSVPFFN